MEEKKAIARKMKSKGFDAAEISEITVLTKDEIKGYSPNTFVGIGSGAKCRSSKDFPPQKRRHSGKYFQAPPSHNVIIKKKFSSPLSYFFSAALIVDL